MEIEMIAPKITELEAEIEQLRNSIKLLQKQTDEDVVLTTSQCAKLLKVSRTKIDSWRKAGILNGIQTGDSNRWLYRKKDLLGLWENYSGDNLDVLKLKKGA